MRWGLVGDESSHVERLARWLADDPRGRGRISAVVRPLQAWPDAAAVGSVHDLPGRVDGVWVMGRDARAHRADAEPLLAAGLPVFVDKPLVPTPADLDGLLAAAASGGGRLASFSALRWQAPVLALADAAGGGVRSVRVSGPSDPANPHGGRLFYAPHAIELALALAPGPVGDTVAVRARPGGVQLSWDAGAAVEVRLGGPGEPFRVEVAASSGERVTEVPLPADYFVPVCARALAFLAGGPAPLRAWELRDGVRLLAAVPATWPDAGALGSRPWPAP